MLLPTNGNILKILQPPRCVGEREKQRKVEPMESRLLKSREAARYLSLCERKLWAMTQDGIIPAVRIGRAVRYDRDDLDQFIQRAKIKKS